VLVEGRGPSLIDARRRRDLGRGKRVVDAWALATVPDLNTVNRVKNHSNEIEFKFRTRSNFF
jgi:hypothetical protein